MTKKDAIIAERDAGSTAKEVSEKYNLSVNYINQIYRQARGKSEFRRDDHRYAELLARIKTLEERFRVFITGRITNQPKRLFKKKGSTK
jgi:hypothetical protein